MIVKNDREFQGTAKACAVDTLGAAAVVEEVGSLEQRVEWDRQGFTGFAIDVSLRAGMELCISEAHSAKFLTLPMDGSPTGLTIILSRGTGVSVTVPGHTSYLSGAGMLEVTQIKRPVEMQSTLVPGAKNEFVVLNLAPERMSELLGVRELPPAVQAVVSSDDAFSRASVPMSVELFRLLDELIHYASGGLARQLYLEGKSLEILARAYEQLSVKSPGPRATPLSTQEVEKLHHVRRELLAHLASPPTLSELASTAGLSETKLKLDFRALFGSPIYTYLRDCRMTQAHQLLAEGEMNVTEIASQVGYSNASKFASAFRKHFGSSPTEMRAGSDNALRGRPVPSS